MKSHHICEAPLVSVVIPCLNERETIGYCVGTAEDTFASSKIAGEVVVADNGSTDGSDKIAEQTGARVIHVPQRGYGLALQAGIRAARGRYVVIADGDCSYDLREVPRFASLLQGGAQLVMGCRLRRGGGRILPGAMPWLHQFVGTPILTSLARLFFGLRIRDINCGMRGFVRDAILGLDLQSEGMEYASEMLIKAQLSGLRIVEMPITLHPDGRGRAPHLRTWSDGWRHLSFMLLHTPLWLFLVPGLALMALGLATIVALFRGPVLVLGASFDRNTFVVGCLFVLVGVHILGTGIVARLYADVQGVLPLTPALKHFKSLFSLERGLITGGVISASGVIIVAMVTREWIAAAFQAMPDPSGTRLTMLGCTLVLLGLQIFATSFIVGFLTLSRRRFFP